MDIYGSTRSTIKPNHALITPDTHVRSPLIGWKNSEAIIHIAPVLGARFMQYTAIMGSNSQSAALPATVQRFVYVLEGSVELSESPGGKKQLGAGGFVYLPPGSKCLLGSGDGARLEIFEKKYVPLAGIALPSMVVGNAADVSSEAFMGDDDAQLKTLLPKEPAFDMAVNLFTFQPGATLPLVEIHVMEHGFLLLEGAGVYRLDSCYYPITAGDVIWMGSFCPQWWVAMGKKPSTYLYYKDVHRDSLEDA